MKDIGPALKKFFKPNMPFDSHDILYILLVIFIPWTGILLTCEGISLSAEVKRRVFWAAYWDASCHLSYSAVCSLSL